MLPQQLCGKHDIWHNFQDEKYFKKKNWNVVALAQLKYSRDILHTQISKKLENILNKLLKKLAVYVLHQIDVRPLKDTTTHLSMFPNKEEWSRENELIQERSRDVPDVVDKNKTAFSFVLYKRYLVGTSDVTTISNDWGNILQISHKTLLEKKMSIAV